MSKIVPMPSPSGGRQLELFPSSVNYRFSGRPASPPSARKQYPPEVVLPVRQVRLLLSAAIQIFQQAVILI